VIGGSWVKVPSEQEQEQKKAAGEAGEENKKIDNFLVSV